MKTYHPGDRHQKYDAYTDSYVPRVEPEAGTLSGYIDQHNARWNGNNEPMLTLPKRYVDTLRARAEKASRRRAANRSLSRAYIALKAENASLRDRLVAALDKLSTASYDESALDDEFGFN